MIDNSTKDIKVNYGVKLFDPRWIKKKKKIFERDGNKCVICKYQGPDLIAHHKQYHYIKRLQMHLDPWDYNDKYLITLCKSCHRRGHYRYNVPIKFI